MPLGVSMLTDSIFFWVINIYVAAFDAAAAQDPGVYPLLYFLPSIYTYSSIALPTLHII